MRINPKVLLAVLDDPSSTFYPQMIVAKGGTAIAEPKVSDEDRKIYLANRFAKLLQKKLPPNLDVILNCEVEGHFLSIGIVDRNVGKSQSALPIAINVEICQPYASSDRKETRQVTDIKGQHTRRDKSLSEEGWTVLRLAEIQVQEDAEACVRLISRIILSIVFIKALTAADICVESFPQWSSELASRWSYQGFREKYLGITSFSCPDIEEVFKLGQQNLKVNTIRQTITEAADKQGILLLNTDKGADLVSVSHFSNDKIEGFSFVSNSITIYKVDDVHRCRPRTTHAKRVLAKHNLQDKLFARMTLNGHLANQAWRITYRRPIEGASFEYEETIRTIKDIGVLTQTKIPQHSLKMFGEENLADYLSAYCLLRNQRRIFRWDRILKVEVLDLGR